MSHWGPFQPHLSWDSVTGVIPVHQSHLNHETLRSISGVEQQFTHQGDGFLGLYSFLQGLMWLPPCPSSAVLSSWMSSCFTKLR